MPVIIPTSRRMPVVIPTGVSGFDPGNGGAVIYHLLCK